MRDVEGVGGVPEACEGGVRHAPGGAVDVGQDDWAAKPTSLRSMVR
ncbi:hypothetical protein ACWC9T_31435 [Kitasatospora sp. NPDC001159]